jgi:hypothetical protein
MHYSLHDKSICDGVSVNMRPYLIPPDGLMWQRRLASHARHAGTHYGRG